MRRAVGLTVLVLLTAAGCRDLVGSIPQFLSADPQGGGRTNFFDAPPESSPTTGTDAEGSEREVVEPDVIRQQDDLLYVLNQYRGLMIVDLEGREVLSETPTRGYPRDLYLRDGRAYVLTSQARDVAVAEDTVTLGDFSSRLYIVDVSDPAAPLEQASFEIPGNLADSSLVGDILYAITAEYQYYYDGVETAKTQLSETTLSSFDVSDPADIAAVDTLVYDGTGQVVRATSSSIYVAQPDYESDRTTITRIDIDNPNGLMYPAGQGIVPGTVADRFKMDEYGGALRVFSNTGWSNRESYVSTFALRDGGMDPLGQARIEAASGETLFATRFDGPRAYAVTYRVVDPLFVIDLSDPAAPVVSGELVVPGWSTHIVPLGEKLLALGVDDTNGRRASVSLFDVADPAAPALIDRESFGSDWTWSTAYDDVKALAVIDNLVVVPFSGWDYDAGGYYNRLQFLTFSDTDVALHGAVEVDGQAVRSFELGSLYYGVTPEEITIVDASDLDTPEVIGDIMLAENVVDFLPLAGSEAAGVEVVQRWERNEVVMRAVDAAGSALGAIALEGSYYQDFLVNGSQLIQLGTQWNDNGYAHYDARIIDFSDPAKPVAGSPIDLGIAPVYHNYWWGGPVPIEGGPGVAVDAVDAIWYPYPYYDSAASNALIDDGYLIVVGSELGSSDYAPAAAILNLASGGQPEQIDLPFDESEGVYAADGRVYAATKRYMSTPGSPFFMSAYYLTPLDPASGSLGESINVPGQFVDFDADRGLLLTQDFQWGTNFDYRSSLVASTWDGAAAPEVLDRLNLNDQGYLAHADARHILVQQYTNGIRYRAYAISDSGQFVEGPALDTNGAYPSIRSVDGDTVYVDYYDGLLLRYTLGDTWELRDVNDVYGWIQTIRYTSDQAIMPLGYAGILRLER
ncbi:MAG: hypothetical protein GC168_00750 [Candidatus Hydrogenedens sp.]|nr:hypothetical protein [Candidatus Hydrogenedens sp.]